MTYILLLPFYQWTDSRAVSYEWLIQAVREWYSVGLLNQMVFLYIIMSQHHTQREIPCKYSCVQYAA